MVFGVDFVDAKFILELSPFVTTIIIETLSSGGRIKFTHQLKQISIDEIVEQAEKEDIENAAIHSFHYEQCMRYYDFATIATFIVFLTKALDPKINSGHTAVAGVTCICVIIALRVYTRGYFEGRSPNKYGNLDRIFTDKCPNIDLHRGEIGIVVANTVPVLSIFLLELVN